MLIFNFLPFSLYFKFTDIQYNTYKYIKKLAPSFKWVSKLNVKLEGRGMIFKIPYVADLNEFCSESLFTLGILDKEFVFYKDITKKI